MRVESMWNGPSLILVAISTLMLQLALYERQGWVASEWIQMGIAIVLACVVHATGRLSHERIGRLLTATCFAMLITLPFVWDAVQRSTAHWGQPFEIRLVLTLRNMMLGLAAQQGGARSKTFAALASCFLALFSILWLMNGFTVTLLFIYTIVGMWWLMGVYWDRLSGCLLTHSERCVPWRPVGLAVGLVGLGVVLLLPLATGRHFTTAVAGLLPSSGGTRWSDEFAYGGVGDGPQMVSAKEDASGFGPIESELFLESAMPSLYDCFNEFSNAPLRAKNKRRQRAIPLAPNLMRQNHEKRGSNQRTGREFSTVRQRKLDRREVSDLRSHALLQVAGRVPVHLGLYTYDLWDGHVLATSNQAPARTLHLDTSNGNGRNWARYIDAGEDGLLAHRDRHEIRIINLKTDRVPSPPNIVGVHIDKLHTETLFNVTEDGMLALDLEQIPQSTVMHVESLQRWSGVTPELASSSSSELGVAKGIEALAREWTAGVEEGWRKVETICERLRQEYVLDAEHMVPADTDDAAAYFLLESKRGPDYLFATSAALLIRCLGYDARVVSGFYADLKHYDRQSRLTSVFADDTHFWVEVLAAAPGSTSSNASECHWLPVEPTPGYQVLLAPESLWSRCLTRATVTWLALKRNPIPVFAALALCTVAWIKRAAVCDFVFTRWWEVHHRWGDARHQVIATLRLLDRRARARGFSRPKGVPLQRWQLASAGYEADDNAWADRFRDLANWALYGEGIPLEYAPREVSSLCRDAVAIAFRPQRKRRLNLSKRFDRTNA